MIRCSSVKNFGRNEFAELDYRMHRQRVRQAKSQIDNKASSIRTAHFGNFTQLGCDFKIYRSTLKLKKELLIHMNKIQRTRGLVQSFPPAKMKSDYGLSKHYSRLLDRAKLQKDNENFGKRIAGIKSTLDTSTPASFVGVMSCARENFVVPTKLLEKYEKGIIKIPPELSMARLLFRPKIYFDFAIKGIRPLGRVMIQLYTEAAPQIVLELMRVCSERQLKRIRPSHIFPELWMEMQVDHFSGGNNLEYDERSLDHSTANYVLTFPKSFVHGFPQNKLIFSITFKVLKVLNRKNVAFGFVKRGTQIFDAIRYFGTKNGLIRKPIIITGCGIYQ